jgi:hypothetical protein
MAGYVIELAITPVPLRSDLLICDKIMPKNGIGSFAIEIKMHLRPLEKQSFKALQFKF